MAWISAGTGITCFTIDSSSHIKANFYYDYYRDGSYMYYKTRVEMYVDNTGLWYNNRIRDIHYVNGTNTHYDTIKGNTGGAWGSTVYAHETGWLGINITTGTSVSASIRLQDEQTSSWLDYTRSFTIPILPAGSVFGPLYPGSTLTGPIVRTIRYDSSFRDVVSISYNGRTITRGSTSSSYVDSGVEWSFSEAERLSIFQAQGAGVTRTWTINMTTYASDGSTVLGTDSNTINITTEALSQITSTYGFNVPNNSQIYVTDYAGGTYRVYAYVYNPAGTSLVQVGDYISTNNTTFTTTSSGSGTRYIRTSSYESTLYQNITGQSKTIYYKIYTYINGTEIGNRDYVSNTATLQQSLCGPSLTSFQYRVTDTGTKTIMGIPATAIDYTNTVYKELFIKGKTTLEFDLAGSAQTAYYATIASYKVSVNGTIYTNTTTSGTATVVATTPVSLSGTIEATIVDSRGFTNTVRKLFTYTVNNYFAPSISTITVIRNPRSAVDPDINKYVKISFVASYPAMMLTNASFYTISYRYKVKGAADSTYSAPITLTGGTVGTTTVTYTSFELSTIFDTATAYDIEVKAVDYYNALYTGLGSVSVSSPLLSRRAGKLGINKIPDGDLKGLYLETTDNLFNQVYPIGSIYLSVVNTNPTAFFGGTWVEWGSGRFIVGVDTGQTEFNTVEKTGGSKTYSLGTHTHTGPSHTHTGPSHTHTINSHTHSFSSSHSHPLSSAGWAMINHHDGSFYFVEVSGSYNATGRGAATGANDTSAQSQGIGLDGNTDAGTASGTTGGSGTLTSNADGTGNTGSSGTGNTGAGGSATINTLPPYITCYMWKRTL